MLNVGTLFATLKLVDRNFTAGLQKASTKMAAAGQSFKKVGASLTSMGKSITRNVAMPLGIAAAASLKFAATFETSLTKMITLVGLSAEEVEGFKAEILDLSGETAKAPAELADAMFFITSAGLRGADALEALTASAKASAIGLGQTETIADAVTSAVNAYGSETLSATRATNIMALAVRAGKLEASSLAPVLGRLLPTASEMGISFEQVAGTLAVMSRTGLDAAEASTSLNAILTTLKKPTTQAADALENAELNLGDLRDVARGPGGVIAAMRLLDEKLGDNEEALIKVIPNIRAFRGAMNVLGQEASSVDEVMRIVTEDIDILDSGMATISETTGFQFQQLLEELKVVAIEIADAGLVDAFKGIVAQLKIWLKRWKELEPATKQMAVKIAAVAAAVGPLMRVFGGLFTGIGKILKVLGEKGGKGGFIGKLGFLKASLLGIGITIAIQLAKWRPFREFIIALTKAVIAFALQGIAVVTKWFKEFAEWITPVTDGLGKFWNVVKNAVGPALDGATKSLNEFTDTTKAETVAVRRSMEANDDCSESLQGIAYEAPIVRKQIKQTMEEFENSKKVVEELGETTIRLTDEQRKLKKALNTLGVTMPEVKGQMEALEAASALVGTTIDGTAFTTEMLKAKAQALHDELERGGHMTDEYKAILAALGVEFATVTTEVDKALTLVGIKVPDVAEKMDALRLAVEENAGNAVLYKDAAQRLFDEFERAGVLLPGVKAELEALGAAAKKTKDTTADSTKIFQEFFKVIKTGVTWIDTLVQGIFKLIDSLMKDEGLKGALDGIGDIVSGIFGGKDSKTGQLIGGMIGKLPGLLDMFSKAGAAAGGTTAGGGGIGGWITSALGGLFGAGGAAAAGGGAAAAGGGTALGFALPTIGFGASSVALGGGAAAGGTALAGGAAAAGGLSMASIASFATGPYGIAIMAGLALWKSGALGKMAEGLKSLFGVSKAEQEARVIKASVNDLFDSMLEGHAEVKKSAATWIKSNVVIRDSYLAIGKTQAEADAAVNSMHDLQKKSPAVAQRTIDGILLVVNAAKKQMEEQNKDLLTLRNDNHNAAVRAAKAAQDEIMATAKKAKEAAAATAAATAAAVKETATAATEATKTSIAGTLLSVVSACGGMKKVAKESAQEINESFTRSLESVKDAASATAGRVKESFDIDLTSPLDRFSERISAMNALTAATVGDGGGDGGGGGAGARWEDSNAARMEALIERLPSLIGRSVQSGMAAAGSGGRQAMD